MVLTEEVERDIIPRTAVVHAVVMTRGVRRHEATPVCTTGTPTTTMKENVTTVADGILNCFLFKHCFSEILKAAATVACAVL